MITITPSGLDAAINGLQSFNAGNILRRLTGAVRRTLKDAKTFGRGRVNARYTARGAGNMGSQKVTASGLRGSLTIGGRRNPLKKFIVSGGRGGPKLYAQIVRGQGGTIARGFAQKRGYYQRLGRPRYPIRRLNTIGASGMWKAVGDKVEARMAQRLGIEINSALGGM